MTPCYVTHQVELREVESALEEILTFAHDTHGHDTHQPAYCHKLNACISRLLKSTLQKIMSSSSSTNNRYKLLHPFTFKIVFHQNLSESLVMTMMMMMSFRYCLSFGTTSVPLGFGLVQAESGVLGKDLGRSVPAAVLVFPIIILSGLPQLVQPLLSSFHFLIILVHVKQKFSQHFLLVFFVVCGVGLGTPRRQRPFGVCLLRVGIATGQVIFFL